MAMALSSRNFFPRDVSFDVSRVEEVYISVASSCMWVVVRVFVVIGQVCGSA